MFDVRRRCKNTYVLDLRPWYCWVSRFQSSSCEIPIVTMRQKPDQTLATNTGTMNLPLFCTKGLIDFFNSKMCYNTAGRSLLFLLLFWYDSPFSRTWDCLALTAHSLPFSVVLCKSPVEISVGWCRMNDIKFRCTLVVAFSEAWQRHDQQTAFISRLVVGLLSNP